MIHYYYILYFILYRLNQRKKSNHNTCRYCLYSYPPDKIDQKCIHKLAIIGRLYIVL